MQTDGTEAVSAKPSPHNNPPAVSALIEERFGDHPLLPVLDGVRKVVLKAHPGVTEGVKWNAASFYCAGWFATASIRPKEGVMVVLHHGAKTKKGAMPRGVVEDPEGLLRWHGEDRASVSFASEAEWKAKKKAFAGVVKGWSAHQWGLGEGE